MNDDHNLADRLRLLADQGVESLRAAGKFAGKRAAGDALKSCERAARDGHRKYSGIIFSGTKARAWVDAFFAAFKAGFDGSGLRVVVYERGRDTDEFLAEKPADVRVVEINAEVSW